MTLTVPKSSPTLCEPRYATKRTDRKTRGAEIAAIAKTLGQPLMPWQRLVADVGLELEENGLPAYREVVVTVPRQSGKTTLILAWELHRALMWGGLQSIAYTAQTGQDARKKLIDDQYDKLLKFSPFKAAIRQVKRAAADTAIIFKNGSRVDALATSEEAGHGKTLDLGVVDEAFADEDSRREQALRPAMATRPAAQQLTFSTAGTEKSTFLKQKVDAGREAVEAGSTSGIAYFEWSADDDADLDDPVAWADWMPALGYTITPAVVQADRAGMSDGDFRRAYGNLWTVSDERVIPAQAWTAVCDLSAAPTPRVFGVDAPPERTWSSIAVADATTGELIDHRQGVGWLLERLVELHSKWGGTVAIDVASPVGHLIAPLQERGIPVVEYNARTYGYACGSFYDRVMEKTLKIRADARLDDACAGATKRALGDAWAWNRRQSDTVISPLVALTLAFDAAAVAEPAPDAGFVFAQL